jgi:uncharacterized protein with LGFP repeats
MRNPRMSRALLATAAAVALGVSTAPAPAYAGEGSYHCHVLVYGSIEDKYLKVDAQAGPLGCPADVETAAANSGRWEQFTNGTIFWSLATGAHIVWGQILPKWVQYGRERDYGYPLTDEMTTPDGDGRYNHFQNGTMYWTANGGANATC